MSNQEILIADDDASIRTVLSHALGRAGYSVRTTGNAATLWNWVEGGEGDLVITDVIMPDENGLDLIPRIKKIRPNLRIIVMSAQNTLLTAVNAAEKGAFEYLPKPFDLKELVTLVKRALDITNKPVSAEEQKKSDERLPLIGRSQAMQEVYRTVARLINTDLTVMITGESGTGKELVARALHDYGHRKSGSFVAINMAAIPKELIESELFGHEKGSFTGADTRAIGKFELAAGGTLFLDEIGDMPLEAQTRLLRVIQEGEYTSVGGLKAVKANVRIIAATHRDLPQMISNGLFREDLYYRLNVVPVNLPPLRQRPEDIPELIYHFLSKSIEAGLPLKTINQDAIALLQRYHWPGNIRELENLIKRISALYVEENIGKESIEVELSNTASSAPLYPETYDSLEPVIENYVNQQFINSGKKLPDSGLYERLLHELERPLLRSTLIATKGNQIKAAHILGLNRNTLRKKVRELSINILKNSW